MFLRIARACIAIAALSVVPALCFAAPRTIGFTGLLTNPNGSLKPDGAYTVKLALYDAASSGNQVWSENKTVNVTRGLFSTALGDKSAIPSTVNFNNALFVGVSAGGNGGALDPEMVPRIALQGVPYAILAESVASNSVDASGLALDPASLNRVSGLAMNSVGGNVGIGTTAPVQKLDVRGEIAFGPSGQYNVPAMEGTNRIVYGFFQCSSPAVTTGPGFTAIRLSTGTYQISFTASFANAAITTLTPIGGVGYYIVIYSEGSSTVYFHVYNSAGNLIDPAYVNFITIGSR